MKTSEVLLAARELIATPEKWTCGNYAKTSAGVAVSEDDDLAIAWCAMGAIRHEAPDREAIMSARHVLERVLPSRSSTVADWNDAPGRTHAEVIEALTKAAALAAAEEQL